MQFVLIEKIDKKDLFSCFASDFKQKIKYISNRTLSIYLYPSNASHLQNVSLLQSINI